MEGKKKRYAKTDSWKAPRGEPLPEFVSISGRNWEAWADSTCVDSHILASFTTYNDFVGLPGTILKDEPGTRISRIHDWAGADGSEPVEVILKWYRYSHLARVRTLFAYSKSQREFDGLHYCRGLGVPAAEPVAWGVERTAAGMVRSCFLITRYLRGAVTLRDWLKAGHYSKPEGKLLLAQLMSEMGGCFRRMHGTGFFHLRPATKDILVHRASEKRLAWNILDFCYARFLGRGMLARWAQKRDLGTLLNSVTKYADAEAFDSFWTSYLPDPLGGTQPEDLVRRARDKEQTLLHKNLIDRAGRTLKRWLRKTLEQIWLPLRKP